MLIVKPQSLSCSFRPVAGPGGLVSLVVTAMAAFKMQGSRQVLCSEQNLWKELAPVLPAKTAPDLGFIKGRSEWLAFGRVYPTTSTSVSALARTVMERDEKILFDKRLHVSGERRWLSRGGIAWPSEPEPLKSAVFLDWVRAYGGAKHDTNPSGVGAYVDGWVDQRLPQIEYAQSLISSPDEMAEPAGFGPVPLDAPKRFKPFGTYDARWKKQDFPGLASDTPSEVLMVGPRDQHLDGYFLPGDRFTCEGMSRNGQSVQWTLPNWQARCFVRRAPLGRDLIPLEMRADTVLLLPHAGMLGMIWRGSVLISESDAHDVTLLCAALEDGVAPKPLSHYSAQIAVRTGLQKDAALAMLDESPLLPDGQLGSILPVIPPATKARMQKIHQAAHVAATQAKNLAPVVSSQSLPIIDANATSNAGEDVELPAEDESIRIADEIVEILSADEPDSAKLAPLIKRARELGEQARKKTIKKIEEMAAEHGVDIKAITAQKVKNTMAGPPDRRFAQMTASLQANVAQGALAPEAAQRAKTGLEKMLEAGRERYRKSAHWMPEAAPLADPKKMGAQIAQWASQGVVGRFASGSDWVGADLSGQQLDGVKLAAAFLDGANFSNASLVGADLKHATLSRADLSGANLSKADLSGANLGRANLSGACLDGANLTGAILDQAQLDRASFQNAVLVDTTLIGVQMGSVDFTRANFNGCKLLGLKLAEELDVVELLKGAPAKLETMLSPINMSRINASHATFHKAALVGCEAQQAQFLGADFLNATLAHCSFKHSNFSGATFSSTSVVLGSSLARSNFQQATIQASFFREIDLQGCDMRGANLGKSYFGLANMSEVNASEAKAAGARFERTNLSRATFASAQLTAALFTDAELAGASFDSARLTLADFTKAKCDDQTDFSNAVTTQAKMPEPQ